MVKPRDSSSFISLLLEKARNCDLVSLLTFPLVFFNLSSDQIIYSSSTQVCSFRFSAFPIYITTLQIRGGANLFSRKKLRVQDLLEIELCSCL